jgi:cytochrome c oxidase subunit 2
VQKLWSVLFGVVLLGELALFAVSPVFRWWLPEDVSSIGYQVDYLFYLILVMTGFFFVLTCGLLVFFMWRYQVDKGRKAMYTHGNHKLEWFWTVVVGVLLLLIAIVQIPAWAEYKYERDMPSDAKHVFEVSARQFEWRVRYPSQGTLEKVVSDWEQLNDEGGAPGRLPDSLRSWERTPHADDVHVVNEVHTWRKAKVRLFLKSRDVLHSFFLPNLRLKQDAVPGKTIQVWFEATEANVEWDAERQAWKPYGARWDEKKGQWDKDMREWDLACAELCGWGHSKMQGKLWVHKDYQDYLEWLRQAEKNETSRLPRAGDKPKNLDE